MTKHPDLFAALAAPFEPSEVKARAQSGRQIHYVTARTVMNRLDGVLGPENWWDEYTPGEHSVLCRLTIRLPDGTTLTKADAGGYAGMADQGDDDKSGYSDSFKRAAVKFGVARYLYRDGVPDFVAAAAHRRAPEAPPADLGWVHNADQAPAPGKPAPAAPRPGEKREREREREREGLPSQGRPPSLPEPPRTGKGLYRWVREREQEHGVGLLKYLNHWGRLQDFPARMVDWDAGTVALALAEGSRKLAARERDREGVAVP